MEGMMQYPPGDSRMIDKIVHQLKSQGIFDQFRKECLADVDTKPAYQNLHQRVEGSVSGFLASQEWRPDLNKNQLRDSLRKHIHESGFLDIGVERIVDQVVNPKIMTVFMPQVEDVVYKFLGIEKPKKGKENQNVYVAPLTVENLAKKEQKKLPTLTDLLPKELEPISPESDTLKGKEDHSLEDGEVGFGDEKEEEDSSPPFEPIERVNSHVESSMDSHLSGISELTSHDSQHSHPVFNTTAVSNITPSKAVLDLSNNDSQLSKVSSGSRLSIVSLGDHDFKLQYDPESNDESQLSKSSAQPSCVEGNIGGGQKDTGMMKEVDNNEPVGGTSEESNSSSNRLQIYTQENSENNSLDINEDEVDRNDEQNKKLIENLQNCNDNEFDKEFSKIKIANQPDESEENLSNNEVTQTTVNDTAVDISEIPEEKVEIITEEQSSPEGIRESVEQKEILDIKHEQKLEFAAEVNGKENTEVILDEKPLVRSGELVEGKTEDKSDKLERKVDEKSERRSIEKLEKKYDEKFERKTDEKGEKKLEEKHDRKVDEKSEKKHEKKYEKQSEEKMDRRTNDKIDRKADEKSRKSDDKSARKADEKKSSDKRSDEKSDKKIDERKSLKSEEKGDKKVEEKSERKSDSKTDRKHDKQRDEKDKSKDRKDEKKKISSESKDSKKNDNSHSSESDKRKSDKDKHKKEHGENKSRSEKSSKHDSKEKDKSKREEKTEKDAATERTRHDVKDSKDEKKTEDKEKKSEKDPVKEKSKKEESDISKHDKEVRKSKSDDKKERDRKEKQKTDEKGRTKHEDKHRERTKSEGREKSDKEKSSRHDDKSKDSSRSSSKENKDRSKQDGRDRGKETSKSDDKKHKDKLKHDEKSNKSTDKGNLKKLESKSSKNSDHKSRESGKKSKDSKGKSITDDHRIHRDKHFEDRRSADRDSNGTAQDRPIGNTASHTNGSDSQPSQSRREKSGSTSTSSKSDNGGNSDSCVDSQPIESFRKDESYSPSKSSSPPSSLPFKKRPLSIQSDEENSDNERHNDKSLKSHGKIKKPKIAANIFEVKKIMMLRKSLAKKERKQKKEMRKSEGMKDGINAIRTERKVSKPVIIKRKKLGDVENSLRKEVRSSLSQKQMPEVNVEKDDIPALKYFEPEIVPKALTEYDSQFLAYVKQLTESGNLSDISIPSDSESDVSETEDVICLSDIDFDERVAKELGARFVKTNKGTEVVFDDTSDREVLKSRKALMKDVSGSLEDFYVVGDIGVTLNASSRPNSALSNWSEKSAEAHQGVSSTKRRRDRSSSAASTNSNKSISDKIEPPSNGLRSRKHSDSSLKSRKRIFSRKRPKKDLHTPIETNPVEKRELRKSRKPSTRYSSKEFASYSDEDDTFDGFPPEEVTVNNEKDPKCIVKSDLVVVLNDFKSSAITVTTRVSCEDEDDSSDREVILECVGDGYDVIKDNNNIDKGSSEDERGCGDGSMLNQDLILPTLRDLMVESGFRREDDKSDILPSLPDVGNCMTNDTNEDKDKERASNNSYSSSDKANSKRTNLGRCRRVGLSRPRSKVLSEQGNNEVGGNRTATPSDFVMPLSPESDVSASSGEAKKALHDKVAESHCDPAASNSDDKTAHVSNSRLGDTETRRSLRRSKLHQ